MALKSEGGGGKKKIGPPKISGMTLLLLMAIVAVSAVVIMPETACALELDGKIDSEYYWYGEAAYHANADYPQADGFLFVIDNNSIDANYIWAVWILNASFNDNSYGANRVGWIETGHVWDDLSESDKQRITFKDNCIGATVFDADFDVASPGFSTNSTYDVAPWGSFEALVYSGNGNLVEYNTSTVWNVNYYWDTEPYNEIQDSPSPYGNYTPHENYTDWEFRIIWEIRMNRTLFGGCGINVSATDFTEIHASPNKLKITPPTLNLTSCLGDFVWEDTNNNGIQEADEPVIRDATVGLYYSNDTFIANTTTDWWGFYKFTNLTPGNYYVKFYNPNTSYYIGFSPQNQSTNDKRDSDADTTTGQTAVTNLEVNETDLTWDAGLPPVPELSTLVLFSVGLLTLAGYVTYSRRRDDR